MENLKVQDLLFKAQCLKFWLLLGSGFGARGSWFMVQDARFRIHDSVFRVLGSGFTMESSGFWACSVGSKHVSPGLARSSFTIKGRGYRFRVVDSGGFGFMV